jgi:hypothetical protein
MPKMKTKLGVVGVSTTVLIAGHAHSGLCDVELLLQACFRH